jgi:hypothetical protein
MSKSIMTTLSLFYISDGNLTSEKKGVTTVFSIISLKFKCFTN